MLEVIIKLDPHGFNDSRFTKTLTTIRIINDGSGDLDIAHYHCYLYDGIESQPRKTGRVEFHDRRLPVETLVKKAMESLENFKV